MTWTLQIAQVSHSTSQLHIATMFHFFNEKSLWSEGLAFVAVPGPVPAGLVPVEVPLPTSGFAAAWGIDIVLVFVVDMYATKILKIEYVWSIDLFDGIWIHFFELRE